MKSSLVQGLTTQLKKMINSIAFYPAVIALLFLALSFLMIHIDFSQTGKQIKAQLQWLRLKDATTARTLISVIAGGILSLTVFSFTMVMVILNQAASQMSNRVLDKLIGNRYQQFVLGLYIGTIVYSLFLLSAIRDIDSGIYVPALSTYLLIAISIIDIFLFIYFLHFITQSVKYTVIIRRIHRQTAEVLQSTCRLSAKPHTVSLQEGLPVPANQSGIFGGFHKERLLTLAKKHSCQFSFLYPYGSYVLKDTPVLFVHPEPKLAVRELTEAINGCLFFLDEQTIEKNFYYGFRQLTEVAVKALSPGINDPGTAVESLRSLTNLLDYRLQFFPENEIRDEEGITRIITSEYSFEDLFNHCILPIWDYGSNDRFIQNEMDHLLQQLQRHGPHPSISKLLQKVQTTRDRHA